MSFDDDFKQYLQKVKRLEPQFDDLAEESTKNALVMPFFAMLGYDVFDTNEFMPEFVCDVATKKGEKVDYAVLKDGDPVMLIEVKRAGMKLQKQQQGQLYRYFSTNRCRVAILTNGVTYLFFSDLNAPNIMDDDPFLSFNLLEDDPSIYLASVRQFRKEKFDVKNVISKAVYQKYAKVVQKTLKQDLLCPSDEIVKYFLSRPEVKTGNRITSQMIEKYREITRHAMQKVMGITIENTAEPASADIGTSDCPVVNEIASADEHTAQPIAELSEPSVQQPTNPQEICEAIQNAVNSSTPAYTYKQEDSIEFLKLHIYTSANQKFGIVKIRKADLSIQLRKFENGIPTTYKLESAKDIEAYL